MIISSHNPKIKQIKKLLTNSRERKDSKIIIIEGIRLSEEALHSGWEAQFVLYSNEISDRGIKIVEEFIRLGVNTEEVSSSVLCDLGDTKTTQGILVLLKQKKLFLPIKPNLIFIPSEIRDPGNLGTMLRTAVAAGVDVILIPPETVDVYAPKVLRSAMGAHFRIPIHILTWDEISRYLSQHDEVRIYGADVEGGIVYTSADFRLPTALIVGGEAFGFGEQAKELMHQRTFIPMSNGVESLNAATASAILLFEIARQRSSCQE